MKSIFVKIIKDRFLIYKDLGERAFEQLDEKEIHYSASREEKSVYVIIKHMHGNMIPSKWCTNLSICLLLFGWCLLSACGKSDTRKLLTNKRWVVEDVQPPSGRFNIERAQRAKQLKNGFYKGAWFEFLADSLFVASFGGKIDTANYALIAKDEIELFPKGGKKAYERILILNINGKEMSFNTEMADFKMTLHLKAKPLK